MKLVKQFLAASIVLMLAISILGFHYGPTGSMWSLASTAGLALVGFGLSFWKPRK